MMNEYNFNINQEDALKIMNHVTQIHNIVFEENRQSNSIFYLRVLIESLAVIARRDDETKST